MLKSRLRMFLNELKLLVLTGGGRPRAEPQPRGGGGGGCGWAPFAGCSTRDGDGDEEEYYGSEPRARGLAGDKEPRAGPPPPPAPPPPPPPGALDALSLSSSLDSGLRTPQCRICFQGPEQVRPEHRSGRGAVGARTWGAPGRGLRNLSGTRTQSGCRAKWGASWRLPECSLGWPGVRGPQRGAGFLLGGLEIPLAHFNFCATGTAFLSCFSHPRVSAG